MYLAAGSSGWLLPEKITCKVKVWKAFYVQQGEQIFWKKDKMGQEKGMMLQSAGRNTEFSAKGQLWFCGISKEALPT